MAQEQVQEEAVSSPPVAAQPEKQEGSEARARLHELAMELIRTQNRRLMMEFLQLRRQAR